MVWTEETVEELKKMWDKGMTTGQIAKALNVTKNSIIGKVHRLCLTARPSPIKKSATPKNTDAEDKKTTTKAKKTCKTSTKNEKPAENKVEDKVETKVEKKVEKAVKEKTVATKEVKPAEASPKFVEETNIPLVKLDNHTCRWPLGDPKDNDFCFCGKRIKTGQTYCEEHAAVAYVRNGKKS